jgi:hypothetical protein
MEPAMDSKQNGLHYIHPSATKNARARQIRRRNTKDLSRAMVEMNQNVNHTKAFIKVLQTAVKLLGTLIDEKV